MQSKIIGTGICVPDSILTNKDLEKMVNTSDEWIVSRTGIRERRRTRNDEASSDLAFTAAKRALKDAGLHPDQAVGLMLSGELDRGEFTFGETL